MHEAMPLSWLQGGLDGLQSIAWLRVDLLLRLLLAAALGGAIGVEREFSGKPAGFRTNLLICVGATLLMELSIGVAALADPSQTNADPARIAAQIVSGIGFLGAGTIIQARGNVIGLTTAATLWVVAAIGMAVGARAYVEAVGTTVLVIAALILLGRFEAALIRRRFARRVQVSFDYEPGRVEAVGDLLRGAGFMTRLIEVERPGDGVVATYQVTGPRLAWSGVIDRLLELPGIHKVSQF